MTGMDILVVIGCVLLAAVIFAAWVVVKVVMAIVGGVASLVRPKPAQAAAPSLPVGWSACRHAGCRATNPDHARFCRRCGKTTAAGASQTVPMRYVA